QTSPGSTRSPAKKRVSPRTNPEKLDEVLGMLQAMEWSVGHFLHFAFRIHDKGSGDGRVHRSHRHASSISKFMRGQTIYKPANILEYWLRSPDGRPQSEEEANDMYSLTKPYLDMKSAHA
ncbi:hypothetical protein OF83DRAFT_1021649, partial [Amylostereum chailletii]